MKSKAINLNTQVTVVLNDLGLKYYKDYINSLTSDLPEEFKNKYDFYQIKDGKYYTSELWDIIHIFGSYICMGKDTPFIDNCIHIDVEQWNKTLSRLDLNGIIRLKWKIEYYKT